MIEQGVLSEIATVVAGQSPSGDLVNRDGVGLPLLNGPTEFTSRYPVAAQWTTSPTKLSQPGDVLFCVRGSTTGRLNLSDREYCIGRGLAAIRAHRRADARFVYYAIINALPDLLSGVTGSVFPNLSSRQISGASVALPSPSHREAIGEVLGALDDKIDANGRVAEAIKVLITEELAAAVGRGAKTVRLGDVARFFNSRRVPLSSRQRDDRRGQVPYWGANGVLDYVDEALFDEPLVLVGEDGSVQDEGGRPIVHYVWGPTWVNNHAHVLTGLGISTELLRYAVEAGNVAHLVTGAVQPKLSMGNLKRLELRVPTDLQPIEMICADLQKRLVAASMESDRLANLRDTLLPHLMSGRISVREAEEVVEEVL